MYDRKKRNMYKLIAFDMDGTLLTSQQIIAKESLQAIKDAKLAGKDIVLATGHSVSELKEYGEDLVNIQYGILESGALIYDFKNKEVLSPKTINKNIVEHIINILHEKNIMVVAVIEGQDYIQRSHFEELERYGMEMYHNLFRNTAKFVDDIDSLLKEKNSHFEKINIYHFDKNQQEDSYRELILEDADVVKAEKTGIEITALGVKKGNGLKTLCKDLQIPLTEAIAVGDADNDESMIQEAGLGIAMGNANDNIKELASVTVNDNDNGGCAQAIYDYLLS
jgi:Cof subfamily protein (haloacid dehalogenase superfamily)